MRLLGGLTLLAPVTLGALLVGAPSFVDSWFDEGGRSLVAAVAAATVGVSITALAVQLYVHARLGGVLRAAELMAAGEPDVQLPDHGGGLDARFARAINGISTALAEARSAATVDRLTGVANRQALLSGLFTEVERASRYGRPFSVGFVDIDHFKQVNDTYGHAAGDTVLRGVAQTLKANVRQTDLVGRYGGEEFMLLLTETGVEEAAILAEKLRQLVGRLSFQVEGNAGLTVTISIGIAGGQGSALRVDELVRDADAAMYTAKSLGRNQTYIFAEPNDDARVPRAPISPAGRARAEEIGRLGRDAAESALTAFIAPLPASRGRPSAVIAAVVVAMADRLNLPEQEIERLRVAALLHDLGKVAIPEEILEKPSALTSAEWRTVVQHPRIGQVILEQATMLRDAVPIILHHHERYSGHGYPFGLRGTEIPLGARIVAIADAYDAMTSERAYKRTMTHDQAVRELRRHAGTQFDPELVALFCDLFAESAPDPGPGADSVPTSLPVGLPASADRPARRSRRHGSRTRATASDSEAAAG